MGAREVSRQVGGIQPSVEHVLAHRQGQKVLHRESEGTQ